MALPDELISEILSPALKVPDSLFSNTEEVSPFAKFRASTSAYLLVSKAWLRVATPLLYHTVILRSKAQADALKLVFKNNPQLGAYVKKIRIEGGYGVAMQHILEATPNISDLWLCTHIWSGDTVTGLIRALPSLNPRRFILFDLFAYATRTKQSQALVDTLFECMKEKWKRLTVFEFPDTSGFWGAELVAFSTVLKDIPSLRTVVISSASIWEPHPPLYMQVVAQNPALQRIECRNPSNPRLSALPEQLAEVSKHPSLRRLLVLPGLPQSSEDSAVVCEGISITYNTNAVPDEVWRRIFDHAFAVNWRNPDLSARRPYMGIVAVCKKFARLAQYSLHEVLVIPSRYGASHELLLRFARDWALIDSVRAVHFLDTIFPNNEFKDLAQYFGGTLEVLDGLRIEKSQSEVSSEVWSKFRRLTELGLSSKSSFSSQAVDAQALSRLWRLTLGEVDPTVLNMFCKLSLPALTYFAFSGPSKMVDPALALAVVRFVKTHGNKLKSLQLHHACIEAGKVLDFCGRLSALTIVCGKQIPSAEGLAPSSGSHSIAELILRVENQKCPDKKWAPFFDTLDLSKLPALRSIQLPAIRWPANERDIAKSRWVSVADELSARNVQLTDGSGVGWRKRLGNSRKSKS
ncbi:F-box domain-containing protein [Mycena chlorophos]|uniref:F-box domain-containing protein n=1 Tax=Mycena chlorophos TaxID=658473 RepID=A0A8H6WKX8_MYCCL|nr:F-box domain-containing protein [Mycena chlorophos]